ncbi:MAG: ATP-binding protein, partial [Longimicrobiales bacterium]
LRLEEQVRLAQKMEAVGTLAGGVAHDFNNLLTAIRGNAELAMMELPEDTPAREDLAQIGELVDRATAVTRQLLAFGRKQVLEPQTLDLNALIENSGNILRRFIGEDIELKTVFTDEPATVWADPNQLDQILMNLSLNSRHAMPHGGELMIATERTTLDDNFRKLHPWATPGEYVCLSVSDTGTGMSAETVARIFEPFFTTKGPGQGTGLGLAVVYGIVKQHAGLIHVYSEPDQGTTFKIYLPYHAAAVEAPADVPRTEPAPGARTTILFVEDEEAVRGVAVKQLRRLGYHVLEATNGSQALEALTERSGRVDLVMLDVVMPVMGGPQAHSEIIRRFPTLKFLFMTGYSPSTSHLTPLSGIPGQILHKPFGLSELAAAVEHALRDRAR